MQLIIYSEIKNKFPLPLFLVLIILSYCNKGFAQINNNPIITGNYENQTLESIIDDISEKSHQKIYYLKDQLPLSKLDLTFDKIQLSAALDKITSTTDLKVTNYRGEIWILSKLNADHNNDQDKIKQIIDRAELISNNTDDIIVLNGQNQQTGKNVLKGQIIDGSDKEAIIGATVSINGKGVVVSDEDGNFKIKLDNNTNLIEVFYIGYRTFKQRIQLLGESTYVFALDKEAKLLDEVTISSVSNDVSVTETQVGINRIDIKSLEKLPTFLGERDVVKAVLYNPGVSSIGEGASGFNVRGGNVDQNLIIQDDAILFNSSHALGFFSTFNADFVKNATLHKSTFGSQYGGRLSSVLEVNTTEGSDRLKYKLNVSILSATGTIELPINKKSNFIVSARTTYSNFIFKLFPQSAVKNSEAGFYDVNAKYNYRKGKNYYSISGYNSADNFNYNNDFGFNYSTKVLQASWKRQMSEKSHNKFSIVWSDYISDQNDLLNQLESKFRTRIKYVSAQNKVNLVWGKTLASAGISSIFYDVSPGSFSPLESSSQRQYESIENEKGLESALFASIEKPLAKWFDVVAGIRLNHFGAIGPNQSYVYKDDIYTINNIVDSINLNGMYKSYFNPELRVSSKITLNKNTTLKFGYAKTTQYINQLFNSDTPSPSSQWQLSNHILKPVNSNNFSAGIFKNLDNNNWELTLESYYRKINKIYDYKDFADLFVNPHIETELLEGTGLSQGIEISCKKNNGKLNGYFAYTYSQTSYKIDGINNGKAYKSNFDKPHNLSLIFNYKPIERQTLTANFVYSTGRPTTGPVSGYIDQDNVFVYIYSARNELRIPSTHRLDLSMNFARSHNKAARLKSSWTVTIYNVYARKNPFSVFYSRGFKNIPQANRLALVGTIFPSISFNLEFQ